MSREGCCAAWPKPCSYHEGWQDCADAMAGLVEAAREALTACESGERGEAWWRRLKVAVEACDETTTGL
ncbi:MAG: hypothetical protein M0Z69_00405 [Actinomycetota bacterium]|nr:hypothetical protein [Actinomycetota bacterium]